MNLTDIDLTKATPIDFDDIREGDTIAKQYPEQINVFIVDGVHENFVRSTKAGEYGRSGGSWFLLDRPSPPRVEPGTTGTATVFGQKGVRVMCTSWPLLWATAVPLGGAVLFSEVDVTDFVPDPAPGIPQKLRDALDDLRQRRVSGSGVFGPAIDNVLTAYEAARDV